MTKEVPVDLASIIREERAALRALDDDRVLGLDLETGGLSPWRDPIAVVSLYGAQSGAIAVLHVHGTLTPALKKFLSDPRRTFVTHNGACFDMLFLALAGVDVFGPTYLDTLIAEQARMVSNRRDVRVNLKATLNRRAGVQIKKGLGSSHWMVPTLSDEQLEYCASDIRHLPGLWDSIIAPGTEPGLIDSVLFESRLIPVIVRMTLNGLPLSLRKLEEYRIEQAERARSAGARLRTGWPRLNINSPKQIRQQFIDTFEVDPENTRRETLVELADLDSDVGAFARDVLTMRLFLKREAMYSGTWLAEHLQADGRIHARFWQVGTDTGRFSCSDPNLQQVPKDGRGIFGWEPGHLIVAADYSNIEVVGSADINGDPHLAHDVQTTDVYRTLASNLFHVPEEDVNKDQRFIAKTCFLAFQYGGSAKGMVKWARKMGKNITLGEAYDYRNAFFDRYDKLNMAVSMAYVRAAACAGGTPAVFRMPTGLKRVIIKPSPSQMLNTIVQGTTAAGLKYALVECEKRGLTRHIGAVVHDEIVGSVPIAEADEFKDELVKCMVAGMAEVLEVPAKAEATVGEGWTK